MRTKNIKNGLENGMRPDTIKSVVNIADMIISIIRVITIQVVLGQAVLGPDLFLRMFHIIAILE